MLVLYVVTALCYLSSPPVSAVTCPAQLQHGGGLSTARGRGQSRLELDHWLQHRHHHHKHQSARVEKHFKIK